MRSKYPLLLLFVLLASGLLALRRYQAGQRSPFPLGVAAAGMRYQEIIEAKNRGEKLTLSCDSIAGGYQICATDTDGPRGHMVAAVNDKGRVDVLEMRFYDASEKMRELTRMMAAGWDTIVPHTTAKAVGGGDVLHWKTADQRWSVEMVMRPTNATPERVLMRDEASIARMDERLLPALLVLTRENLVPLERIESAARRAPGSLRRAADTLSRDGRASADFAGTLSLCEREPVLAMVTGTTARETLGETMVPFAEASIALAFPGRHLVLGEAAYLVDAAGSAERIGLTPLSGNGDGTGYVFAVNFEERAGGVLAGARKFYVPGQCRAPAEVIVAHVDTATNSVTSVEHAPIEHEALTSRATSAGFWTGSDGKGALEIGYTATYGTIDDYGQIEWVAVMPLDSMKLRSRSPLSITKHDAAGHSMSGAFERIYADGSDGEPCGDPPNGQALAGRPVAIDVERDRQTRSETIVIPSPVRGLTSGWALLSLVSAR